ncbi:MAG TPA: hypothetical protein VF661_05715, partial [Actinomycetales bacterium]
MTVLATSREALGVDGELLCLVPPLEVPDALTSTAAEVPQTPAAQLFLQHAAAVGAPVEPADLLCVAEICRRLDGIPLALELAAARLRSTSPAELLERLRDGRHELRNPRRVAEARHRTLQAVVAWSYALLSTQEQAAFAQLSVFAGAFSAEAAQQIAGADDQVLHALVDKSMVVVERQPGGTRYRLLVTLRALGEEQLSEEDGQRTRAAHAAYFQRRTQATMSRGGPHIAEAVATVTGDLDELRIAHAWALRHDLDLALDVLAALVDYVELQMPSEVFTWAEQAIEAAEASGSTHASLPLVLTVAASGARFRGDLSTAGAWAQRALDLLPLQSDARRFPLYLLAELPLFEGDLARSVKMATELEQSARAADDAFRVSLALVTRALAIGYGGDAAAAEALALSSREQAEAAGELAGAAWSYYAEGELRIDTEPERALGELNRALQGAGKVGDRYLTGCALVSRASLLGRWHDPEPARDAFRDVIEHWHQAGDWTHQWTT